MLNESVFKEVVKKRAILKATLTALIVGSVLLAINQWGALFGEDEFKLMPAVLTYCVPFVVFIIGKISK